MIVPYIRGHYWARGLTKPWLKKRVPFGPHLFSLNVIWAWPGYKNPIQPTCNLIYWIYLILILIFFHFHYNRPFPNLTCLASKTVYYFPFFVWFLCNFFFKIQILKFIIRPWAISLYVCLAWATPIFLFLFLIIKPDTMITFEFDHHFP